MLKAKDLTWNGGVVWTPQAAYNEAAANALPLTIDGKIEADKFQYGEPGAILDLWLDPKVLDLPESDMNIYTTIKRPGEREHHLPAELASLQPYLSLIADHQFTVSAEAEDKVGWLMVRQWDVFPGKKIGASALHQDYNKAKLPFIYPMALAFYVAGGFQLRDLRAGLRSTWDKTMNSYHVATVFPTLIQSRILEGPLDPDGKMNAQEISAKAKDVFSERPALLMHSQPTQAALTNNYTWHATPPAAYEARRLYINMFYVGCR